MGSTYSQQLTFSHIIYYICWLVLNLALLENWFLDSMRNEEHSYHLRTVAGWSAKLHGLEQFDQRYGAPVISGEFLPQAVKIPGWHNIIYSLFVFFEMGSVKQRVFFEMGSVKQHVFFEMGSIKQLQTCPQTIGTRNLRPQCCEQSVSTCLNYHFKLSSTVLLVLFMFGFEKIWGRLCFIRIVIVLIELC